MTTQPPDQLTRADLASMTLEAIDEARRAGRLDVLLGIKRPEIPGEGPLTVAHLRSMTAAEIDVAQKAGRLGHLLDPEDAADQRAAEHRMGDIRQLSS